MNSVLNRFGRHLVLAFAIGTAGATGLAASGQTQRHYLSGHGPSDAVSWEFFCTGGRRSGEWTTIPVPSQWEQHGFGNYDYGQGSAQRADERGQYRTRFNVPAGWAGQRVRIVFEGVMTDTRVTINGQSAGPVHVGGFYRFRYDITDLVKRDGDNLLEVEVAKVSATPQTEIAERHGDYWVFGGIYRPVYLESVPPQSIDQVSVDARADGSLLVDVELALVRDADRVEGHVLTTGGDPVGEPFTAKIPGGGGPRARLATRVQSPRLWSAETPNLYHLRTTLWRGGERLHEVITRFGFRTFEVRAGAGLFLNGRRIVLAGVNRHSFRPDTGRALNREDCYDDVRLIQAMNMNAVRMSHYPPDVAFLEACDELGLYVLDELSGWQRAHDTETGRRLVREMITRDVNHPSIIFWDNGNEGGWNRALDVEFSRYDPQQRPVLHPWETYSGIDTVHYRSYADMQTRSRGPHLIMPTEFLHAMYDGGGGAGLADYWTLLSKPPYGAGGFIWALADEGIVRTDQGGRIDVWSTYGPDGLVGPRHEREGSFHTVREVFSPVQIDAPVIDDRFDGRLTVHNHYSFTSAKDCRFAWRTLRFGAGEGGAAVETVQEGAADPAAIEPGASGELRLSLPADWTRADALAVSVFGPMGRELWSWVWPTRALAVRLKHQMAPVSRQQATLRAESDVVILAAAGVLARFDARTGRLREIERGGLKHVLSNGPRLVWARPAGPAESLTWRPLEGELVPTVAPPPGAAAAPGPRAVWTSRPREASVASVLELKHEKGAAWCGARIEISDGKRWTTLFDGTRRPGDGDRYVFSPQVVSAVRISDLHRSDQLAPRVASVRLGHAPARYPSEDDATVVMSGTSSGQADGTAWVEARGNGFEFRWTMRGDGSLELHYRYSTSGPHVYRGVTFDLPEEAVKAFQWIGRGPHRVWQNRLHGTWFGAHELTRPGVSARWQYPEFTGYFADARSLRMNTSGGSLEMGQERPDTYVRIGTPLADHSNTTAEFPPGNFSIMDAIPAMGSKFRLPAETGPSSAPVQGPDTIENTVVFRFGP